MTAILASGLTGLFALAAALGTLLIQQRHQRAMAREERLWSRRAETYVDVLQHHDSAPAAGYRAPGNARELAIRGDLTARVAAFASAAVRDLWQWSALAFADLREHVSEAWPEFMAAGGAASAEILEQMEKDPEFCRLRQAASDAAERLARQIRAELNS